MRIISWIFFVLSFPFLLLAICGMAFATDSFQWAVNGLAALAWFYNIVKGGEFLFDWSRLS